MYSTENIIFSLEFDYWTEISFRDLYSFRWWGWKEEETIKFWVYILIPFSWYCMELQIFIISSLWVGVRVGERTEYSTFTLCKQEGSRGLIIWYLLRETSLNILSRNIEPSTKLEHWVRFCKLAVYWMLQLLSWLWTVFITNIVSLLLAI